MIDKIVPSVESALADVRDGSTVLVGGFGGAGVPEELIDALIAQGARDLTIVNNNAGNGEVGVAALLKAGRVRKIDRKSTRLNSSHVAISYAVFCLKKKTTYNHPPSSNKPI